VGREAVRSSGGLLLPLVLFSLPAASTATQKLKQQTLLFFSFDFSFVSSVRAKRRKSREVREKPVGSSPTPNFEKRVGHAGVLSLTR